VILLGPFIDCNHQDIYSGDIFVENADKSKTYLSHEDLFKELMLLIQKELRDVKTKVIVVPSHKDITHF
jgi:hypothetical protein